MKNEPVAWMGKDYDGIKTDLYFDVERNKLPYRLYESAIPLYTHPVKEEHFEDEPQAEELHEIMQSNTHPVKEQDESFDRTASHMAGEYVSYQKELTDEKINEVFKNCTKDGILDANEFARAILRKAQE